MKNSYENVNWDEVKNDYLRLSSLKEIQRKFKIGKTSLIKFLFSEGVYNSKRYFGALDKKIKFNIGDKYNRWTIIGDYEIYDNRYVVPVQCECGTISKARLSHVISGVNTGCKHCANRVNYPSSRKMRSDISNYKGLFSSWLTSIKNNSRRGIVTERDLEVSITLEDLYNQLIKQNFKCALTGEDLVLLDMSKGKSNASVDRRDNDKGYTIDNIQWVLKDVNLMKNKFNQDYFIKICNKISEFKQGNPDPSIDLNDQ